MSIEKSLEQIAEALTKLANVTDETPAKKPAKPAPKKPRKSAPAKEAEEPKEASDTQQGDDEPGSTDTGSDDTGPFLSDVRAALTALGSRDKAVAALKKYGKVSTLGKLKETDYAKIIKAIT